MQSTRLENRLGSRGRLHIADRLRNQLIRREVHNPAYTIARPARHLHI